MCLCAQSGPYPVLPTNQKELHRKARSMEHPTARPKFKSGESHFARLCTLSVVCRNSNSISSSSVSKTRLSVLLGICEMYLLWLLRDGCCSQIVRSHYAMRIDWMIWKIADPHTTKMNSANSQGPTGYFSSTALFDLGTLPRWVMLRLAFSLAIRILCWGAIVCCVGFWG